MKSNINSCVEDALVTELEARGPSRLDDLVVRLPEYSWNEIFIAVDRMSRDGRVAFHRIPGSGYEVSFPSIIPVHMEVPA